jgi:hypothetical protein
VTLTVNAPGTLTNVALPSNGSSASASSAYNNSTLGPAMAIDGDRKGIGYWNDGTANSFPDWLQIDFNAGKSHQRNRCLLGSGQFSIANRPDAFDHVYPIWTARL